tara:strand:- start:51 stop:827 length:777 start_codon:yes stop_codon:yes gene_type:complete
LSLNNRKYFTYNNNNTVPLIFIHGVGLDRSMWSPQLKFFKNYTTITYDLLGHGNVPHDKEKLTMEDFKDQLKSLTDYLKIKKFNLIGFSIGSLIALNYASDFESKINSLILLSTTYKRNSNQRQEVIDRVNLSKLNKPISNLALKRWFTDDYINNNKRIKEYIIQILTKNPYEQKNFIKAYELFANYEDDIEKIKKINTKSLVMTGSLDSGSTPEMSQNLSNDLKNSTFVEIKNGKHLCSIECADDVNINIKKFIDNV